MAAPSNHSKSFPWSSNGPVLNQGGPQIQVATVPYLADLDTRIIREARRKRKSDRPVVIEAGFPAMTFSGSRNGARSDSFEPDFRVGSPKIITTLCGILPPFSDLEGKAKEYALEEWFQKHIRICGTFMQGDRALEDRLQMDNVSGAIKPVTIAALQCTVSAMQEDIYGGTYLRFAAPRSASDTISLSSRGMHAHALIPRLVQTTPITELNRSLQRVLELRKSDFRGFNDVGTFQAFRKIWDAMRSIPAQVFDTNKLTEMQEKNFDEGIRKFASGAADLLRLNGPIYYALHSVPKGTQFTAMQYYAYV